MAINYLAVFVAALSSFLLGAIWYGALGKVWLREIGKTGQDRGNELPTFAGFFVLALIAAFVFAMFLGPNPPLNTAVGTGFAIGAGLVTTSYGINYLFAQRSLLLFAIDGGYHTLQFTLMGLVLGLWHYNPF